jgi:hypothetical protein
MAEWFRPSFYRLAAGTGYPRHRWQCILNSETQRRMNMGQGDVKNPQTDQRVDNKSGNQGRNSQSDKQGSRTRE